MKRKSKKADYQHVYSKARQEQERLAKYVERKHGRELSAEEVAGYTEWYMVFYHVYRALLETVVGELRRNIRRRAAVPDDMVRNHIPYIAALLTLEPGACEDFMDVMGLMPTDFQNMFITDQLREDLVKLDTMTRDLNELSRQRLQMLCPDIYANYSETAANPPVWMNTQHLFMPHLCSCDTDTCFYW